MDRLARLGVWLVLCSMAAALPAAGLLAQSTDAAFLNEMQKGAQSLQRKQYEDALKSFKHANELHDSKCAECFFEMALVYQGMGAQKNVVENCQRALDLAMTDAQLRAAAYNLEGTAIQALGEGRDPKRLQEAEAVLRLGLNAGASLPVLDFNLGVVLMQQGRDRDGAAELQRALDAQPGGEFSERARAMIVNPRRARENYAPAFSLVTADRRFVTLDDLQGKVVLLDFWGTWCPPCVAALPSLRDLQKKFANEPFVTVSISSDSDEPMWRTFLTKNLMTWPQYFDRDRKIQRAFDVQAFPTYIVLDQEGIMRYRSVGQSFERNAMLDGELKKQLRIVKDGIIHVRSAS